MSDTRPKLPRRYKSRRNQRTSLGLSVVLRHYGAPEFRPSGRSRDNFLTRSHIRARLYIKYRMGCIFPVARVYERCFNPLCPPTRPPSRIVLLYIPRAYVFPAVGLSVIDLWG